MLNLDPGFSLAFLLVFGLLVMLIGRLLDQNNKDGGDQE
jgi:hypothetical protein